MSITSYIIAIPQNVTHIPMLRKQASTLKITTYSYYAN